MRKRAALVVAIVDRKHGQLARRMQALLAEQFDEADVEQRGLERDLTELSALKAERGLADTVFPEELEPEAICSPAALLSGLLFASVPASHRSSILPRQA